MIVFSTKKSNKKLKKKNGNNFESRNENCQNGDDSNFEIRNEN